MRQLRKDDISLEVVEIQRIAHQLTSVLYLLHSSAVSIAHGDLYIDIIVLEISNVDSLSAIEMFEMFGHPEYGNICTATGDCPSSPSAPRYIVQPADLGKVFSWRTGNIKVIDFGQSFRLNNLPPALGTPAHYCSPELLVHNMAGKPSDTWTLACCIFEIRMGEDLFDGLGYDDETLHQRVELLGPMDDSLMYVKLYGFSGSR
ncbi:uncharacterized protein BP5553_08243 [Venustampulla echinocandica]|uniref:Protein kinase domain-containing protein n=1 Tax=Venustampulla echinocandica TaxID=2656787 RepID=A0A370TG64_9HELO|nr:uncharacterized protein BP5553_08243 [Venustampulla echinocandica]RDL33875.1 hypothetical protein BP5553_08243 [Venustampulla echinocandica]